MPPIADNAGQPPSFKLPSLPASGGKRCLPFVTERVVAEVLDWTGQWPRSSVERVLPGLANPRHQPHTSIIVEDALEKPRFAAIEAVNRGVTDAMMRIFWMASVKRRVKRVE